MESENYFETFIDFPADKMDRGTFRRMVKYFREHPAFKKCVRKIEGRVVYFRYKTLTDCNEFLTSFAKMMKSQGIRVAPETKYEPVSLMVKAGKVIAVEPKELEYKYLGKELKEIQEINV